MRAGVKFEAVRVIVVGGRWLVSVCTDGSDRCTAGLSANALTHTFVSMIAFIFRILNVPKDVN